jgi:DNA-directed RNA polymerase subunit RPC12/RpoP
VLIVYCGLALPLPMMCRRLRCQACGSRAFMPGRTGAPSGRWPITGHLLWGQEAYPIGKNGNFERIETSGSGGNNWAAAHPMRWQRWVGFSVTGVTNGGGAWSNQTVRQ